MWPDSTRMRGYILGNDMMMNWMGTSKHWMIIQLFAPEYKNLEKLVLDKCLQLQLLVIVCLQHEQQLARPHSDVLRLNGLKSFVWYFVGN